MPAEALAKYKDMAPAAFKGHSAVIRASHGRKEVLEGPAAEEILIGCSANWLRNQNHAFRLYRSGLPSRRYERHLFK